MKKQLTAILLSILCILPVIPSVGATDIEPTEIVTEEPSSADLAVTAATEAPTDAPTEAPTEPATEAPTAPIIPGPRITAVIASRNGATVNWSACTGAAKYYLYLHQESGWVRIAKVAALSYEHKNLVSGSSYLYTVRAVDAAGKYLGDFDHAGYSYRYIGAPVLNSLTNVDGGQKLVWNAVEGAGAYRLYIKGASGWKYLAQTTATSYLCSNITSGNRYSYTVRALDENSASNPGNYSLNPLTATYFAAPKVSGYKPVKGGNTITWKAVRGAYRYAIFVKSSGKWVRLAVTDKTSYTHLNLKNGVVYTYTVRCINKNGKYCSGYEIAGKNIRFTAPPVISSISGKVIKWNAVSWTAGYRIYRKQYGKSWEVLCDTTSTSFTDSTMKANTPYTYTVRCINTRGYLISYFTNDGKYYCNGKLANGSITVNGSTYIFENGVVRMKGYVKINGKTYYYNSKGVLQKNGIVGTYEEGYRYADKNGVVNLTYTGVATKGKNTWYFINGKIDYKLRAPVTVNGVAYNVLDGKAYKVDTAEERTLYRALKLANRVAKRSLPKEQRLKILWDYIKGAYVEKNPRIPDYTGMDWPIIYADDLLVNGVGNCLSYAAEFAFLAKAIGYDNVYGCHSGGHGWAEIDGLIYDPEWSMHHFTYNYYGITYNTHTDQDYKGAIGAGYSWMHVKICANLK
ncbi:MAG: hypothetical protein IJ639_06090 [Ruminococcus sp.]|nr:hypothetical protein [Ruminococcus sp.]